MLHFDAGGDGAGLADPASPGPDVPTLETVPARDTVPARRRRPDRARRASDRPASDPPASDPPAADPPASDPPASDPPATASGPDRPGSRPGRAAAAAALFILVAAGIAGVRLALEPGRPAGRHRQPTRCHARPLAAPATVRPPRPPRRPRRCLVASSVGSSTYHVGASATITFRATSGACWVEIRQDGPTGPLLFQGDLQAGQSRALNGPVWVRLGNPTSSR